MAHIDPELIKFATPRQVEYIELLNELGSGRAVAERLGIHYSAVNRGIAAVKAKAATQGYSPEHDMKRTVPEGYSVRGVSTYYDSEGNPRGQWVKSRADDVAREAALRAAYEAMAEELPRVPESPLVKASNNDLCNLYTLTDSHVGMLAWDKEGGDDWDLRIAENVLVKSFQRMIETSPPARFAVVSQLGDFLHWDGLEAVTPSHGHILDGDGRFSKVVAVAIRVLRRVIDMALENHEQVHVVMAEGNHDLASSVWLRHMFSAIYENEKRLTVNDSELPFYVYQHGKTMLAFHHGHKKKNEGLPLMFAAQYPKIWGDTELRYVHVGHRHHMDEKEHSGMKVVQHSTLAARDAYAARGGWHSMRQALAITYHREHGEVARQTVTPGMLS